MRGRAAGAAHAHVLSQQSHLATSHMHPHPHAHQPAPEMEREITRSRSLRVMEENSTVQVTKANSPQKMPASSASLKCLSRLEEPPVKVVLTASGHNLAVIFL